MESPHITFEKLTDLLEGGLNPNDHAEVTAHVAGCSGCAILKMKLERTIGLMQNYSLEEVPSHIFERTLDAFSQRTSTREVGRDSVLETITAVLNFTTSGFNNAFGFRSDFPEALQQFSYQAGDSEVTFQITRRNDSFSILGELNSVVIGESAALKNDSFELTSPISDLGEFSFTGVNEGIYSLEILLPENSRIVVPGISIG